MNQLYDDLNLGIGIGGGSFPSIVTNGGFDSDTAWTKGDGWTVDDPGTPGVANCDGTQAGASNLSQNGILVVGKTYRVKYTIVTLDASTLRVYAGGSGSGTIRSTTGTFTEDIVCSGDTNLYFSATVDTIGSIDNVTVSLVG